MLRVLQVIGKMDRAGAETMIMNLYRNIDRTKIQFDFLVFSEEEADYDAEIKQLGGKIFRMPMFRGYNYINIYIKLKNFFNIYQYEIVHGHIGSLAPVYLKLAKKKGSYTIVHSHATNSTHILECVIYKMLSYKVKGIADYFFACSRQAGADRFGSIIVDSMNFQVLNNGIDSHSFIYTKERHEKLKEQYGMQGKIIFGHVGRFVKVKNHIFLVKIFKEILKVNKDAVLLLVGRGEEESKIHKIVKEMGIQNSVFFLGVSPNISDLMNLFDGFIFPSQYEGLGIVGIEAQAAGLPCFFSEGIVEEAVITNNAWRYALELGERTWAKNILCMMNKFERHNTQKDIVEHGFDIRKTATELQEFYCSCV